jgi:hypothetical protein
MLAVTNQGEELGMLWVALGLGVLGLAVAGLVLFMARRRRTPIPLGLPVHLTRVYTAHAKERMEQRGISREDVEEVLAHPQRVSRDEVEGSMRFEKDVRSMVVRVWVAADSWPPVEEVVVKTTAARHFASLTINRRAVGRIIGRGGSTIQCVQNATDTKITVKDNGRIHIRGDDPQRVRQAHRMLNDIAKSGITRR